MSLIGIFGPEEKLLAVFKDSESIVNAEVDDVLKEQFIVHMIEPESVTIRYVGFPDALDRVNLDGSMQPAMEEPAVRATAKKPEAEEIS